MSHWSLPLSALWTKSHISPEPPPLAKRLLSQGHHLIAHTAALCSSITKDGDLGFLRSQILIKLSFPPDAS